MGMLKSNVARKELVQSIAQIEQEMKKKAGELDRLQHDRMAEIEAKSQTKQSELDSLLLNRQNDLDKARQELETIQSQITQARAELAGIQGQKAGQKEAGQVPVIIIGEGLDLAKMKPSERQRYIPQLINSGVDEDKILDIFGISAKTLERDKKACNGLIKEGVS
jgi:DNA repair exonuclease SbcCD ATPase subunit